MIHLNIDFWSKAVPVTVILGILLMGYDVLYLKSFLFGALIILAYNIIYWKFKQDRNYFENKNLPPKSTSSDTSNMD